MKKSLLIFTLLLAGLTALPASAQLLVGPRGGYNVDVEEAFIGGELRTALGTLPVDGQLGLDYYFADNLTRLQIDANLLYDISGGAGEPFTPYVGAGLGILYADEGDSNTDLGLNLLAGARFNPSGPISPFIQARMTVEGSTRVSAMGGLLFALGRR